MSQEIPRSQIRLAVEDSKPIVIDVESAVDEVYDALADERRREVIRVLSHESTPMELETLVREVAKRERENRSVPPEITGRIRASLYHVHLPKLDALDLITFDPAEDTVERVTDTIDSIA